MAARSAREKPWKQPGKCPGNQSSSGEAAQRETPLTSPSAHAISKALSSGRTSSRRGGQRGGIIFRFIFLLSFLFLIFLVYLARHPLLRIAGEFWIVDDPPSAADAIVILGDDNYFAERAERAAQLYRAGDAPRVVASGRYLRPYATVADLMLHDLKERGVPESAIVRLPHRAANTQEEAEVNAHLIHERGWKRILLVTSNYHTRRSRYIFERVLPPGTTLQVVSAPDTEYNPDRWWESHVGRSIFFHEFGGMLAAWWENRHATAEPSMIVAPARGSFALWIYGSH
jgi:uncharacterized SAM-binding protein YcdF (DUF218 family)